MMTQKTVNPKKTGYNPKTQYKRPEKSVDTKSSSSLGVSIIPQRYVSSIMVLLLFVTLSLIYFPVAYQSRYPIAHDITQWEGGARKIIEYNQENSDRALWTQNMFSGMPAYMISFPNRFPYLESITKLTDKIINWRIFLLFVGGLGVFVLLRFLKLDPWVSLFGAIAFVFSCHWLGLVEIGHNTKFRAIMYVPWVMWALLNLKEKPGLLGLGLMATFLITQLRENHPQITYYLYLFIGMYWVYTLIQSLRAKQYKEFGVFTILLIFAFGLTALAVMNPYLSTMEYSHYTMRGGSGGLETSYAQGWSFHPWEIISLIIPDFFGGITTEAVPGMPQGVGPYWGWMEFTQIYNYFGIVVLFFGLFALLGKHKRLAEFLWISSVLFTLMSFGKFAPRMSDLLLNYLPYFNKFRVPAMILTMVQINAVILAALGIDTIIQKQEEGNKRFSELLFRVFWICGAIFVLWLLLAKTIFNGLPLATQREIQIFTDAGYQNLLQQLQSYRLDKLVKSGIISLLFLTLSFGAAYMFSAKRLKKALFVFILLLITFIDLYLYTGKYFQDLKPVQQHRDYFTPKEYDQFLKQDTSNYRIYPFEAGPSGDWAYHHQTVDGYSAAKLKRYDDFLRQCLHPQFNRYKEILQRYGVEVPTPVHDMLSAKYIVMRDTLMDGGILRDKKLVYKSPYSRINIYENTSALPRAWFVDSLRVVTPPDSILVLMNDIEFDPARLAYVESPIPGIGSAQNAKVRQLKSEMHRLEYDVSSQANNLLVLGEVYYPAGWKAYLDDQEVEIYPVNYILRGIVIPPGNHKLVLEFKPESYSRSVRLSAIGLLLTLICLGAGFAHGYIGAAKKAIQIDAPGQESL